jgi:hypothetical protein
MKGIKKKHIQSTINMIQDIIFHKDYEKYINVFDRDNHKASNSINNIEETILSALRKGN